MNCCENISCKCCNIWRFTLFLLSLACIVDSRDPTLICYNTIDDKAEFNLDSSVTEVLNTKYYNADGHCWYIYCGGFAQRSYGDPIKEVMQTFLAYRRDACTICLVQYDDQANSGLNYVLDPVGVTTIYINYPLAAAAAECVGEALANALYALHQAGIDLNIFHLYGHSLGAQVVGVAGEKLIGLTGGPGVAQVIGIDPAAPGYEEPVSLPRISTNSGQFVAIIHTDKGRFGNRDILGHCDIFVNNPFYDNHQCQPGCETSTYLFCSHQRSVQLLLESLADPYILVAINDQGVTVNFGINIDITARGVFQCCTNAQSPFARGAAGTDLSHCLV